MTEGRFFCNEERPFVIVSRVFVTEGRFFCHKECPFVIITIHYFCNRVFKDVIIK